jgi:hypothetical protein
MRISSPKFTTKCSRPLSAKLIPMTVGKGRTASRNRGAIARARGVNIGRQMNPGTCLKQRARRPRVTAFFARLRAGLSGHRTGSRRPIHRPLGNYFLESMRRAMWGEPADLLALRAANSKPDAFSKTRCILDTDGLARLGVGCELARTCQGYPAANKDTPISQRLGAGIAWRARHEIQAPGLSRRGGSASIRPGL